MAAAPPPKKQPSFWARLWARFRSMYDYSAEPVRFDQPLGMPAPPPPPPPPPPPAAAPPPRPAGPAPVGAPHATVIPFPPLPDTTRSTSLSEQEMDAVVRARGIYLRALGKDPTDPTGKVARMREKAEAIAREAERRRIERDAIATQLKWEAEKAANHGRLWHLGRNIWYGIPLTGAPEVIYPELPDEDALTRGEWYDWVQTHKAAGREAMIDHLASLIPPKAGETYQEWRERLKARRRSWNVDTNEAVVNRALRREGRPATPAPTVAHRLKSKRRAGRS